MGLLEQTFGKDLLYLACRHHIVGLLLAAENSLLK